MVLGERRYTQEGCTLDDPFCIDGQNSIAKDYLSRHWEQEAGEEDQQTVWWRALGRAELFGYQGAHNTCQTP